MKKRIRDRKNFKLRLAGFLILMIFAVIFLAPYFWMLSNSFKSTKEILLEPNHLLPEQFTLESYRKVLFDSLFFTWFKNSAIVSITDTVIILFSSSIIGFVLSKYKFRMNKPFFALVLATMMVPVTAVIIPNFMLISSLGWYDRIISLIVPTFFNAFGIFLCKQYIDDIPKELFESAMLDGATDLKIYNRIVLPMIRPALGSLTIFTFLGIWNDYETPLIYLNTSKNMTLPLALSYFNNQHMSDLSATMAAASLIMLPVTILFLVFQKQFIKGITMTGMK
jgi:multiple sugar transport system permease protein